MKKSLIGFILLLVVALSLSACGNNDTQAAGDKIQIVATTFPQYDWTKQILGEHAENAELTLLLDNGVDLHSYQPTVDDITKISGCDLFLYVGGESDTWVPDALKTAENKDMRVVNLLDTLGTAVKEEAIVEGMEHEHEGDEHDADHHDADEHESDNHEGEEPETDEHVWLSLKNAQIICSAIAQELGSIDPENAANYASNAEKYNAQLAKLYTEYKNTVDAAPYKTIVVADRFPFRYLTDELDLDYYAAFAGCSAETEASFETVMFLAEKINELKLHTVIVTESSDKSIAKTVIKNTTAKNQQIAVLDSMQSVTASDVSDGTSYLSVMENNLAVLHTALYE